MNAVRLHPNSDTSNPYSVTNPAPSSALVLDSGVEIPQPLKPGELLVKIEATTVIRDALTWPETYLEQYSVLGHDFAGTVVAVHDSPEESAYKPGDEVYGMADPSRAGMWAEYAIVKVEEACLKPRSLSWAQAAAVPLTALTAYQALFDKAGLANPDFSNPEKLQGLRRPKGSSQERSILVTGASGAVGLYTVQLAKLTGLRVVAATSSKNRNKDFLEQLGVDEVVEYRDLRAEDAGAYQIIIDTLGGKILELCWSLVNDGGSLISVESASFDFVQEHHSRDLHRGKENVKAVFFIVSPSQKDLKQLSAALDFGLLEPFVAHVMPLAEARLAYERASTTPTARGKIVLVP